jgi:hypothetical protein
MTPWRAARSAVDGQSFKNRTLNTQLKSVYEVLTVMNEIHYDGQVAALMTALVAIL